MLHWLATISLTVLPFSLKDMNNALVASTHLSYDEQIAVAKKCNYQAQYLGNKLQIVRRGFF